MTVTLAQDVTLTDTDSGAVLLDLRRGRYWHLNGSGLHALRLVLDGRTPQDAAAELVNGEPDLTHRATEDVLGLITSLRDAGLLEETR